ncbi:alanine--glyoxylate aminotransferase family protein [Algiphilus sp.]|uniref:alanine--glyoxylate aminotransferase family protein n=1 Tax=Algiphilus sp. TaxID=1872431 RepID=UPI003B526691
MTTTRPHPDPDGLHEFSVVFTDRSLNHMSARFQRVMRDLSDMLRHSYAAESAVIVPGGGTMGMEAVARQFATGKRCLVVRNGWFSYRWSQILDAGGIAAETTVLQAEPDSGAADAAWSPPAIEEVVEAIRAHQPEMVFAPHVETSAGLLLPDDYIRTLAEATHEAGGLFVLDCVASGALWIDMAALGVNILISAPQKTWSATPCAALVMLGAEATQRIEHTRSSSFACDLKQWLNIMRAYEGGGHAYHATLPTDGLVHLHEAMRETRDFGLEKARSALLKLGNGVRATLRERGFKSVAAPGFEAPGVVVFHTSNPDIHSGKCFAEQGLQIAKGVPLMCGEPEAFLTFRVGLFGLDKLYDVDATIERFSAGVDRVVTAIEAD